MGKTRNRKFKTKKKNPTGIASVKELEEEEAELGVCAGTSRTPQMKKESVIQTIIEQLQAVNAENKVCGLNTLATLFQDAEAIELLLKHNIVKFAGPLLLDPSSAVRNSAAGALRNLSACGEHEVCDFLVEQDIMTPLTVLIQQYSGNWHPTSSTDGTVDTQLDIFLHAVNLLWNLCESSSVAVKCFNEHSLLPVLTKCLDTSIFGLNLSVAVAQCLHTVTDDNPVAVSKLASYESILQKLLDLQGDEPAVLLLRTLVSGILINLSYGKMTDLTATTVTRIMSNLSSTLSVDHRKAVSTFSDNIPLDGKEHDTDSGKLDYAFSEIQNILSAQQTAMEILTNICSSDDSDDEWMDQESSDTSDDMMGESCLSEGPVTVEKFPISIPSQVYEALLSFELVEKVIQKGNFPAENICQLLKEHDKGKQVLSKAATLRSRSYLCLHNLVSVLGIEDLGGPNNIYNVWVNIGSHIFGHTDSSDAQYLEAATSVMRALVQRLAELRFHRFEELTVPDLQLMFTEEQQCTDANVRTNLIRIVGMFGMVLTRSTEDGPIALVKMIGRFLLEVCTKEAELWVVAEALDVIMDVFGEDDTDSLAVEINLVDKLQNMLPALKHKVRQQKKHLGDHYPIVMTASSNLVRFIKYKSRRIAGQQNGHAS